MLADKSLQGVAAYPFATDRRTPMPIIRPMFVQLGFEAVEGVSIAARARGSAAPRSPV
jgi:hypothetical protein